MQRAYAFKFEYYIKIHFIVSNHYNIVVVGVTRIPLRVIHCYLYSLSDSEFHTHAKKNTA